MAKLLVILSVNILYIFEASLCTVWCELGRVFCFTWKWKWLPRNQVLSHQFSAGVSDRQLVHLKEYLVFTKFSCILILWNFIWAFEEFHETRAICFGSPDFRVTWSTQRILVFCIFNENLLNGYGFFTEFRRFFLGKFLELSAFNYSSSEKRNIFVPRLLKFSHFLV